jgi:hypothetical protein
MNRHRHEDDEEKECPHGHVHSPYAVGHASSIWEAAQLGNVNRLQYFVDKGTDMSIRDDGGYTSLHYASRNGHLEAVRLLLRSGANPNAVTLGGSAPLHRYCLHHCALYFPQTSFFPLLLSAWPHFFFPPSAAYCGHVEIASLLLQRGAEPNLQDSDGKTRTHLSTPWEQILFEYFEIANDSKSISSYYFSAS